MILKIEEMVGTKRVSVPEIKNDIKSVEQDENKIQGFNINSAGYGIVPKLVMQDRNLSVTSKAIYAYFCSYTGAGNTCFPSRQKICYDLNIHKDTFTKYFKPLVHFGYVRVKQIKDDVSGRFLRNVYILQDKLPCPVFSDTGLENAENTSSPPCPKLPDTVKPDTKINSIKINSNYLSKKGRETTLPVVKKLNQGGKETLPNNIVDNIDYSLSKKERATKSFDSLIDDYTENENLRKELKEHLKTRKMKKAALTNRAIELSLKKLDQLAVSDAEKLLIVQNAVMNGWTTFYPLKADEKRQLKFNGNNSNSSYNLDDYYKNMDTFLDTDPQEVTTNPNAVLENLFRECDVDYRVEQRKKQLEQEKKQKSKDKKPNIKHNQPSNCDQKKIDEAVKKLRDERNTSSLLPEITWQKIAEDVKYLSEKNVEEDGGILAKIFPGDKEYIDTS